MRPNKDTVLVTGGAGFIGSHMVRKLLQQGDRVVIVDNFNDYYNPRMKEQNLKDILLDGNCVLYRKDICDYQDMQEIFKSEKIDKICHLAARAGVRPSIKNPFMYEEVNIRGTLHLLKLACQYGVANFVYASSSSVYGNNTKIPFSEADNVDNPISPYAATKKATELLAHTYHSLYNLPCTGLRFFTVYGPAGRPDMAPFLFVDAVYKGKPIKRFGTGEAKRDFTYIDDIVDGARVALERCFPYEIINLGNNKPVSVNNFITLIEDIMGKKALIEQYPDQPGDVKITYADITKAQQLLGYSPHTSLEEGMNNFILWYRDVYVPSYS